MTLYSSFVSFINKLWYSFSTSVKFFSINPTSSFLTFKITISSSNLTAPCKINFFKSSWYSKLFGFAKVFILAKVSVFKFSMRTFLFWIFSILDLFLASEILLWIIKIFICTFYCRLIWSCNLFRIYHRFFFCLRLILFFLFRIRIFCLKPIKIREVMRNVILWFLRFYRRCFSRLILRFWSFLIQGIHSLLYIIFFKYYYL